jgi:hypothetical protein
VLLTQLARFCGFLRRDGFWDVSGEGDTDAAGFIG